MQKFIIAIGHSRTTKVWKNIEITWKDFVKRLETTTRTSETQGEFFNMSKPEQDNIKDVGGFVGGKLLNGSRKANNSVYRSLITLDADFAGKDFCEHIEMFFNFKYCIYSTHKHTPENPRLRLIIPLSRTCTAEEYEAVSRLIASDIGIDMFDDTTYQAHRLMYWASTSIDGEYIFKVGEGDFLDPDTYLQRYENWKDVSSWAVSSRTLKVQERLLKKQEDPTVKKGLVGAFCRAYNVEDAIEVFLSDIYFKCDVSDRYTYVNGSTSAGLIIYDNGNFAYSHHSTDVTSGMLCNAFDLVRIHKFSDLDDDVIQGTPTAKYPSYLKMQELAANDKKVRLLMQTERDEKAKDDFIDLIDDMQEGLDTDVKDWILQLAVDNRGIHLSTIDNVKIILANDKFLKSKIAFNEFTKRHRVLGRVPWDSDKEERDWTDTDDAGLRYYFEKHYSIKGKPNINDAWTLIAKENSYHPVRDFLNSIVWDGVKRIDTLFIDYVGAEDNDYVRTVTRKALVAAVARIFIPGIKYDTMPVLVGEQGVGKSYIIKRLGEPWSSDSLTTVKGKEAFEQLQGFWIIEIGELSAMKKAEVETVKQFITKTEDAYRAAYGVRVESHKRQCVFFGTTNTYEFLKDMTGNRRFWVIDVHKNKIKKSLWEDLTKYEISQIWAEAVQAFRNGEDIHIKDEKIEAMAVSEQNKHLEESPLTGDILEFLNMPLPDNWDSMELSERRAYIHGNDFREVAKGTIQRQKVCVMEIWVELFNGEKKDLTATKSKEIKDIILKTGEWELSHLRFGKLYGIQRGFKRKIV